MENRESSVFPEPDATSEEGVAANGVNGNASSVGKGLRPVLGNPRKAKNGCLTLIREPLGP